MPQKTKESRLGETKTMNCGQDATIVEYTNSLDILIRFSDGTLVKTRYDHFKNGGVSNPSIIGNRVGESAVMKNGLKATITNYRNTDDIDVRFEDGVEVKNKAYRYFKKGYIKHPNIHVNSIKPKIDHIGDTNVMSNGQKATVIDYRKWDDVDVRFEDGYVAKGVQYSNFKYGNVTNPNKKAIRKVNTSHLGESKMMKCGMAAEIIEYRKSDDIDVCFEDGTIIKNRQYSTFNAGEIGNSNCKAKARVVYAERLGEIRIMNNGHPAQIIRYGTSADIDVRFDNGIIVEHTEYSRFKEGNIANPNDISKGRSLQEFVILYYLKHHGFSKLTRFIEKKKFEVDVFSECYGGVEYDGRVWHRGKELKDNQKSAQFYKMFGKRLIHIRENGLGKLDEHFSVEYHLCNDKPFSDDYQELLKRLFITEFRLKVDVNFERDKDDICREYYSYCYHIGERKTMNCGQIAEIITYRGTGDLDVRFEDGTVVSHAQYSNFKRGTIVNPTTFENRLGEKKKMNCGIFSEIIAYRKAGDIDVQFEDGIIIEKRTYQQFAKGSIVHPLIIQNRSAEKRIGTTLKMRNGQSATIIAYRNTDDIDVQFEDGTVINNTRYFYFTQKRIGNPNYKKPVTINDKGRIGERRMMNCGVEAEIIAYRKWDDIDVKFEDGTIVTGRQYSGFKQGTISNKRKLKNA